MMKPRSNHKSPLITSIMVCSMGAWMLLVAAPTESPDKTVSGGDEDPDPTADSAELESSPSSAEEATTAVPAETPTPAASEAARIDETVSDEAAAGFPAADGSTPDDMIPDDALLPEIPVPDGMALAATDPFYGAPIYGPGGADAPYSLPMSGAISAIGLNGDDAESSEALDENDPDPADDRSAPWVAATGGLSGPSLASSGAGFAPAPPSGFTSAVPSYPIGGKSTLGGILDGFSLAANFSTIYNSNVTNSPGEPIAPIQDDIIFSLGGTLSYMSTAKDWTFGGSYTGSYNQYLEQTDYSGYNQSMNLVGNFDGPKLNASLTCGIAYTQGSNRYYSSDYVEQTSLNLGLNLRYKLSAKTSLQGNIGQSLTVAGSNSYNDTETFNMGLAALWRYSKLTELGPGIRYTYTSGGSRDARTSIGPELLINYQLAKKVSMNSRVGVEFPSYESGGSADPTMTGSLGLNYNASKLWGMNLSLYSGTRADGSSADVFRQENSLRVGYHRKVRRATLNLGVSYEIDTYETTGTAQERPDQKYFNIDSSLGMPLFSNSTFGSIFLQYSDQSGGASQTWDSIQTGFNLSRSF